MKPTSQALLEQWLRDEEWCNLESKEAACDFPETSAKALWWYK